MTAVSALVGFLLGVVLSYLSALQLRTFGADAFIERAASADDRLRALLGS